MGRITFGILGLTELFLSTAVHLLFGFYIFSTAVASDLSQSFYGGFRPLSSPNEAAKEENSKGKMAELDVPPLPPIVLVHGIFGFGKGRLGGLSYFAGAEKKDDRVLVPDLGSLTSIYDRARELFFYLKGGQVDYGEEHSMTFGHSRFGKVYHQGNYPEWDEHHPIHFVGHSAGAQVVRVMQQMLADKAFAGYENTSEDWVLSLTSLSGALNGTTRTYYDGMQPEDGRSMKTISLLQFCRLGVIIYDWLDISFLKNYYNFGFDHFNIGWRKTGLLGLIDLLLGNAGPFASGDWILPDLTIQGSLMCQWRHPKDVPLPYKGYRDEDWEDNDGALNTVSMTHPRLPVEHPSHFVVHDSECHPLQPGIWYYKIIEADHIFFIVNRERAGVQFDVLYDGIFERCRKHVLWTTPPPTVPNQTSH
ncbi:hypothetical protein HPP92_011829 [Vanilla planifolia]|uniref:Lipase-like C-terminal domain-containing protein n=1 Tax=Vanilla planifolia TaxID=51239 RepID=A0A835V2R4_VANPL|nr:hypothetical protein HPP92_011829 [Vanilla planifolia]